MQFDWVDGTVWIAKPNQGERGMGVRKISSRSEMNLYHAFAPRSYILQEYVDHPAEFGLFFVRTPDAPEGRITSLCSKDPVAVTGDGHRTLRRLCEDHPRFARQTERLENILSEGEWDRIPADGEVVHLDVIRNHRRGSCFRDARDLITDEMTRRFQEIFPSESGFNYGRVDLRATSAEALQQGRDFKILEVNGVTSEPGEIYDPAMSLQESLAILRRHWGYVAEIGRAQLAKNEPAPKVTDIYKMFRDAITRPAFFDR